MEKGVLSKVEINKGYGLIKDVYGAEIFFHANDLKNISFAQLQVGNVVFFDAVLTPKGFNATRVERQAENKTTPGLNPRARLEHFSKAENDIVFALSQIFYISNGGTSIKMGVDSKYSYCLLKPTSFFSEQFNLHREIILVFSDYETFEPRTLDAISRIYSQLPALRLDRICSVLLSKDPLIESKLKDLLKSNAEMQVIIPFSYSEILSMSGKQNATNLYNCVIKRFRSYFYERDLFAFFAPLQKDLYFFGRQTYVQELVNKHFSHENSGVFGLRRSGKTSVLNAVHRTLDHIDRNWIWLDGQNLSHMNWVQSLSYIIEAICRKFNLPQCHTRDEYFQDNAAILFEQDLILLTDALESKCILILLDEIEHITFDIALDEHWKSGKDFIYFWQVLRAFYQKYPEKMNFIIAGTNPKAIETARINGYDNPLYKQLQADKYLSPFSVQDTKEMINKLGAYMGLSFDDFVCATITQDMGGHPFLIRQLCSRINSFILEKSFQKPITVTKTIYEQVLPQFDERDLDEYCEMILDVLKSTYPEEFRMLEGIALEDATMLASQSGNTSIISHLVGYGIIEKVGDFFSFKNEAVKKFILNKNKYSKVLKTDEEKRAEISERRNRVEPQIRQIVKLQLKSSLGESAAKDKLLNAMQPHKRKKYTALSYNDLFDPKKCEVYFHLMSTVINSNWNIFSRIFSSNQQTFLSYATIINNLRLDCHASNVTDDEMLSFRGAMTWLENEIKNAI